MQAYWFSISLVIAIALGLTFDFLSPTSNSVPSDNVKKVYNLCTEKHCEDLGMHLDTFVHRYTVLYIASSIVANLDRTVDPCDDFYQFACGGWMKNNPVNYSHPIVSVFNHLQQKVIYQVKEILEDKHKPSDTLSLKKARRLYAMCKDELKGQPNNIRSLVKIIRNNTIWPIFMSSREWKKRNFTTWSNISNIMHKNFLFNGLYDITVDIDQRNTNSNIILIGTPPSPIKREEIIALNDSQARYLYEYTIQQIAVTILNTSFSFVYEDEIKEITSKIVDFEIELSQLITMEEDRIKLHGDYIITTIKDLQLRYNKRCTSKNCKIHWHKVLTKLFSSLNIKIESSETVCVLAYEYLQDLVQLLKQTPSYIIANYIQWTFIKFLLSFSRTKNSFIETMGENIHDLSFNSKWWINCVKEHNLFTAVSHEYIKRFLDNNTFEDINDMIMRITNVVYDNIVSSTWMDKPTKWVAMEKLVHMNKRIGGPYWYNNTAIDKYYKNLNITKNYLESVLNLHKFKWKKILIELRKPVDGDSQIVETTDVNAFLNNFANTIILPAAILQEPIYNIHYPLSINYATIGSMIGHEINHAFDSEGQMYDDNGKFGKWWSHESITNFENIIVLCFVDQYNNYEVNGELTLNENLADSAGIAAAYEAYKREKAKLNKPEIRMSGLEQYSDDQIFFISFAFRNCENMEPNVGLALLGDEYVNNDNRVRGSLSNLHAFSVAYNCSKGQRMNPEKKCSLW